MANRSRLKLVAVLAVAAVTALGCVPDPPSSDSTTTSTVPDTPVPTTLSVAPVVVELHPGEAQQLTAEVLDQHGDPLAATVSWTSDDPTVAEVSSTGLIAAMAPGQATVTATVDALTATSEVTVTAAPNTAPEITITSPTGDVSVNEIDTIELAASATDAQDGDLGAAVTWTLLSAQPGAEPVDLGVGPTATAGPLAPGDYTLSASVTDTGGLTASSQINATVAECVTTAVLTPGSGTKDAGPVHLSAAGSSDSCGRPLRFGWACITSKNPQKCTDLMNAGNNGKMVDYTFDIEVFEELAIQVRVCAVPIHAPSCRTKEGYYTGAAPVMG